MTLRRGLATDLPFILQQEHRFRDLGFVGGDDARTHERQLADPDCLYLLIEVEGAPAGYAILRGLASVNGSVELKRIVIAEPGQGLGRRALQAVIQKVFQEFHAHRFWLDVFVDNVRARHVYRALGFVEEGTLRECIKRGETYRSLVVMSMLETESRQ
ncbi:MAG: GNAT family N-acetyltransferase [Candidatus Solibacter usitatus]|nr:GNAT family N-acetyltransferase [Candidatus Solibacter usitatus]